MFVNHGDGSRSIDSPFVLTEEGNAAGSMFGKIYVLIQSDLCIHIYICLIYDDKQCIYIYIYIYIYI